MAEPSLSSLRAFVAVARHGSFRQAAIGRGVDPSAFSHVVRDLEQCLDVRLFHRTSRSVRLTEAGAALLRRVGPALDELSGAFEAARASALVPSGSLRLNVPRIANDLIIAPMVGRFLSRYPAITLEVVTFDGLVDIVADGFDAGIRRDRRLSPGMVSLPIGAPRRFAVVAAPAYFAGRAVPREPADLREHRCIVRRFPSGSRYAWEFEREGETLEFGVEGPLVVDDTALMIRAALDGVGLAFLFEELVAEHVAAGTLIRVLESWCPPRPRFHLYYPGRRQVPAPLRAFIDMLREG
ncbi:LysR family transcriptional regulator [Rhizosaccharibacter radicis]|uniref:LysR family transcriptional regulator n=1 Tax=Rhizosaccharibacter radicis TaxID=2782605 RepID=A0ABT1VSH8_9PROT|nr:LysR family transcriptional regulator [Acetobacteraceae bacterium KSS12]